ncbi:MAG TPA: ribosome biogenesis GTP-binding protein YihA/YsxC [Clostridia bacterium]|nr:ribosome biogenesis GTP-binding protein YihA/YsxC [Clostridia bacterium]
MGCSTFSNFTVLPEIAVAGKSNVGKSSMINRLCNRRSLARTSGTPGKTRLLNIYCINDAFHLVDLPGYGFAKVSKKEKERWGGMMENYFAASGLLCHALHLVDIRHEPTEEDQGMAEFLRATGLPWVTVATKADKISKAARARQIHLIARTLMVQPWDIIAFSAEDGTGVDELSARLGAIVPQEEPPQEEAMETTEDMPEDADDDGYEG